MSINKLLWIPRILTILFALFLSLFSLDVFSMEGSFLQKVGGLVIHNIPSFLLIIVLIVSWKRPLVGGIAFLIFSILFTIYFETYSMLASFLSISLPLVITGGLYLLFYFITKRELLKNAWIPYLMLRPLDRHRGKVWVNIPQPPSFILSFGSLFFISGRGLKADPFIELCILLFFTFIVEYIVIIMLESRGLILGNFSVSNNAGDKFLFWSIEKYVKMIIGLLHKNEKGR